MPSKQSTCKVDLHAHLGSIHRYILELLHATWLSLPSWSMLMRYKGRRLTSTGSYAQHQSQHEHKYMHASGADL